MFFYIYPIVPYAPAFLHSFLLLVTVLKGIGLKHHLYFYSVVLEFSGVILHVPDSTLRISTLCTVLVRYLESDGNTFFLFKNIGSDSSGKECSSLFSGQAFPVLPVR